MSGLKYYDLLGHLIPGLVFLAAVAFFMVEVEAKIPEMPGGEGVSVLMLTAVSFFIGNLLATIASFIEPALFFLWGGRPSRRILIAETPHIHANLRDSLRRRLANECGLPHDVPPRWRQRAKYLDALFARARSVCNRDKLGRVAGFNAKYALHRSFFVGWLIATVVSLLLAHRFWLSIEYDRRGVVTSFIVTYFVIALITFFRTRQRGYYYVREVLEMYQVCRDEAKAKD